MAKIGITIPKPEPFLRLAGPLAQVPSGVGQGVPPAIFLTESSESHAIDLSSMDDLSTWFTAGASPLVLLIDTQDCIKSYGSQSLSNPTLSRIQNSVVTILTSCRY